MMDQGGTGEEEQKSLYDVMSWGEKKTRFMWSRSSMLGLVPFVMSPQVRAVALKDNA